MCNTNYNKYTKPFKAFVTTSLLLLYVMQGLAQNDQPEFPKLAPPTPNAVAMHTYGNNSVSYYSGRIDISIPIYTITEGDLELPISLSYNGGNGIKIEEQASWVGLGWTLNAGGAVSRTKRGVADEAANGRGFLSYTEVPEEKKNASGSVTNIDFLNEIASGRKDGEPDKFVYTTPTGSGSFFINYDASIHQKPYKNVAIAYGIGTGQYQDPNGPNCNEAGTMNAFFITDEYGTSYEFQEKERSNSRNIGGNFYDKSCYPTSWLLTKMKSSQGNREIGFEYDGLFYSNTRLTATVTGTNETEGYIEDYFLAKNLRKITFSEGSVEFITSQNIRKDLENNRALERILVKDKNDNIIKEFEFNYNYFTKNALISDSSALSLSNENRLALISVQEIGSESDIIPPYRFIYNTDYLLPETFSKAKDHWGFYNGRNNTKFQAAQVATWFNGLTGQWVTTNIGSADRNPRPFYAQANILKRMVYPSGGYTDFEYEGNKAIETELQNSTLESKSQVLSIPDAIENIDVILNSTFNTAVNIEMRAIQYPNQCTPIVRLVNTATNAVQEFSFEFSEVNGLTLDMEHLITPGNYNVSFYMQENQITCNPDPEDFDYFIMLNWKNEVGGSEQQVETDVGGLRIKKITDTPLQGIPLVRNFIYENDQGKPSGHVVSIPRYWFQNYTYYPGTQTPLPLSLANRSASSQYPMVLTAGNTVGYSKVTVIKENGENGKTDYHFSSPKEHPDKRIGYIQHNRERDDFMFQGQLIRTYPVVTENSREYLRGKLLKQVDYERNGVGYRPISKIENFYKSMTYNPDSPGQEFAANKSLLVKGVNIVPSGLLQTVNNIKEYEIHSGYIQLEKTVTTKYYGTTTTTTETKYSYPEDDDGALTHMLPVIIQTQLNDDELRVIENFYAFNALSNPDRLPSQNSLINALQGQNRVYESVQVNVSQKKADGSTFLLGKRQNLFKQRSNGAIVTEVIKTGKAGEILQERLRFVSYDNKGNLLEAARIDGPNTSYVWGYDSNLLIAKIENASYNTMSNQQTEAINEAISASDLDAGGSQEALLQQKLARLKAIFPNAMVTSYTYDPLVGVTSTTDPRGYTMYYKYDGLNRLQEVRDASGDLVTDYEYGHKQELPN